MPAFVLSGVAFAKSTVPGYVAGLRLLVQATVDLNPAFIAGLDAETGGAYANSAPVTLFTINRLDTGALLYSVANPGSVTVSIGALQRTARDGKRPITASVSDYSPGAAWYAGAAFLSRFDVVGAATISDAGTPTPLNPLVSGGLLGRYYNNLDLVGFPVYEAVENMATPLFNTTGSPRPAVSGDFSARWTGAVQAATTGLHRFQVVADDGCRLFVNGNLAIDSWSWTPGTRETGSIQLTAGTLTPFWLEFFDGTGNGYLQLRWLTPGATDWVDIPSTRLYPSDGSERPPVEARPPQQGRHYVETINRY